MVSFSFWLSSYFLQNIQFNSDKRVNRVAYSLAARWLHCNILAWHSSNVVPLWLRVKSRRACGKKTNDEELDYSIEEPRKVYIDSIFKSSSVLHYPYTAVLMTVKNYQSVTARHS